MSLYMYFNDEPISDGTNTIIDVDAAYEVLQGSLTDDAAKVIKEIDGAVDAKDGLHFIDRWGAYEPWNNLSTGSKAAVVIATSNNCVDTRECGINAMKSIVKHIKNGKIIMEYPLYSMPYGEIDVVLHNKHFSDGEILDKYIKEECL